MTTADKPASESQRAMSFLHALAPESAAYTLALPTRIHGPLDERCLGRALDDLVDRHDALRTSLVEERGDVVRRVDARRPVDFAVVEAAEPALRARVEAEIRRPIDLAARDLFRVRLYRLAPDQHLLFLIGHHSIVDMRSLVVLLRELLELHAIHRAGAPAGLPPLSATYDALVDRQRAAIEDPRHRAFWAAELEGIGSTLDLPTDRPRPAMPRFHGATTWFTIPREVTGRVDALAAELGTTRLPVVLAAFGVLLSRHADVDDLVVGTAVSIAPPELAGVVGLMVNLLPLRMNLSEDPTPRELISAVAARLKRVLEHRDYPFARIAEAAGVEQGSRFVRVMVNQVEPRDRRLSAWWAPEPGPARVEIGGLVLEPFYAHQQDGQFDLSLWVRQVAGILQLELKYDTDLFEAATVARMAEHLARLLDGFVSDPARPVLRLPMLSLAERARVLVEWNATEAPFPSDGLVHRLFESAVDSAPGAVALITADRSLTYGALEADANRLARHLRALGVGRGDFVAVHLERSLEMIVSVLGILKAGAAYVPLDPAWPVKRVDQVTRKLGTRVVLAPDCMGSNASWRALPPDRLAPVQEPTDPAYVIFTSGSTGTPKGVQVSHRSAVNVLDWVNATIDVRPDDRLLFVTALTFDLSVYDIFGTLAAGASLRIADRSEIRDPERLAQIATHDPITIWDSAPATFEQILPFVAPGVAGDTRRLRMVMLSGDWVPLGAWSAIRERFPGARLLALGGATETTVWSTYHFVDRVDPAWVSVPYGRPIRNARQYVLDRHLEPTPIGVPGDLFTGGECLADGYANEPELTAAAFIENPHLPGTRMYRTGDRARLRPDGSLEFLGRRDAQVKIRGHRVELAEVEAALDRHPSVRQCAVAAIEDRLRHKRLAAHVVFREGHVETPLALATFLRAELPEYMVPAFFSATDRLPLSSSGKLDRRALPPIDLASAVAGSRPLPPRTPGESALAAIWCDLLGRASVGVDEDFFELGGDSLLALQLVAAARQRGMVISTPDVVQLRTIRELATVARAGTEASRPPIVPDLEQRHERFPLNDIQRAYWLGEREDLGLGGVRPHLYLEYEIAGFDLERMERALARMIARHDALRLVAGDDGHQRILREVPPYCIAASAGDPAATRAAMIGSGPTTTEWPLFDLRVTCLDGDRARLHLSLSLLVADYLGGRILLRELEQVYRAPETSLPALDLSFRDYVLAERALSEVEEVRRAKAYWHERIASLPLPLSLPTAKPSSALRAPAFTRHRASLGAEEWAGFEALAARAGVPPSTALAAAYALVLSRAAASPSFALTVLVMRRCLPHPDVQRVVGNFSSTTLLAVDLSGRQSFQDHARGLHRQLAEDLEHAAYSGVRVASELVGRRPGTGLPAPVVFASTLGMEPLDAHPWALIESALQTSQVWLDHQVYAVRGGIELVWDEVTGLFADGLIAARFADYRDLVGTLATSESAWADRLPGSPAPALAASLPPLRPSPEPPRGELENELAAIWEEALGVRPAARGDAFFDLGGNSVLAVQVLGRMRTRFEVQLPFESFLGEPTIEGVARHLAAVLAPRPK